MSAVGNGHSLENFGFFGFFGFGGFLFFMAGCSPGGSNFLFWNIWRSVNAYRAWALAYFLAKIVACSKRVVSGGTPEVRQRYAGGTRAVEPEVDQRYARVTGEYPMLWIHNLIPPNFKTTPKDNREKRRRIRNEVKPFWQAIKPKNRNFGNNCFIHASIQSCRPIL